VSVSGVYGIHPSDHTPQTTLDGNPTFLHRPDHTTQEEDADAEILLTLTADQRMAIHVTTHRKWMPLWK